MEQSLEAFRLDPPPITHDGFPVEDFFQTKKMQASGGGGLRRLLLGLLLQRVAVTRYRK